MKISKETKGKIIDWSATVLEVGVPLVVTATQFPIWVDRSPEATISGTFILFAFLACIPFISRIKDFFKSPSAPIMWFLILMASIVVRNVADEVVVIAFFGTISNFVGSGLHKLAKLFLPLKPELLDEKKGK